MNRLMLAAGFAALGLSMTAEAAADTLSPGEILGTSFTTVPNTSNVVDFSFGSVPLGVTGSPVVTADLYNGSTLLASYSQSVSLPDMDYFSVEFGTAAGFASVPFKDPDSVTADFTAFNNGTIEGRLAVSVSGGSVSGLNFGDLIFLSGTLFNEGDFAAIGPPNEMSAAPFSISSATPEPASILLVGCSCLFAFAFRRFQ